MSLEYACDEEAYEHEKSIHGNKILSATQYNTMNEDSLDYHRQFDPSEFATILGYESIIDEVDLGKLFVNGTMVELENIGEKVFFVVRGHHRATVAAEKGCLISCCEV